MINLYSGHNIHAEIQQDEVGANLERVAESCIANLVEVSVHKIVLHYVITAVFKEMTFFDSRTPTGSQSNR
jgi:hypothetical protein